MEIHIQPSQVSTIWFQWKYTMATSLRLNHRSILPFRQVNGLWHFGWSMSVEWHADDCIFNTPEYPAPTTLENNIIWKVFILDLCHVILWFQHVNFAMAWIISAATAGLVGRAYLPSYVCIAIWTHAYGLRCTRTEQNWLIYYSKRMVIVVWWHRYDAAMKCAAARLKYLRSFISIHQLLILNIKFG